MKNLEPFNMKKMAALVYRKSRQRTIKRCVLWLFIAIFLLCILFLEKITIQTVSNKLLKYQALDMVRNTDRIADPVRNPRLLNMTTQLPPLGLDITSQLPYQDLDYDPGPSVLHYIWCGDRYFEFRHYLALKSGIKLIKPEAIYFHYSFLPKTDTEGYYTWFDRIQSEIVNFVMHKVHTSCEISGHNRTLLALNLLHHYGGIYIPESSIVMRFPIDLRSKSFVSGIKTNNLMEFQDGLITAQKQRFTKPKTIDQMLALLNLEVKDHDRINPCYSEMQYRKETNEAICVNIERSLNPKDIWFNENQVSLLGRLIMYDVSDITYAQGMEQFIPRISHYICIVDCEIKFVGYLSMLSALHVAGLNMVYIHGPVAPSGVWWGKLSMNRQFIYIHREIPYSSHDGQNISQSLAINLMRMDILLKYGGVYQDQNTLWTQKIPDNYFGFETVVSLDWHKHGAWPDSINHCAMMSKKNAEYVRQLQTMFVIHREYPAWFVDHYLSYKIIELHPELVFIAPHLQVKCLNHNCHPTWQKDYRSTLLQNKPGQEFIWQNETFSVHWVDNFPELNANMVRYTRGAIIDICCFILRAAGVAINSI